MYCCIVGDIYLQELEIFQLRQYLMERLPPLPTPRNAREWETEARELRARVLEEVIFHGWPRSWVEAEPKFDDLGIIATGRGYRLRGLRYEILPGFQTTALLYEPDPWLPTPHRHDRRCRQPNTPPRSPGPVR